MKDYKLATVDDIIADAIKHGREGELKAMASKKIKGRKISFLELKQRYYETYYPDLIPRRKEKAPTFWDRINEL